MTSILFIPAPLFYAITMRFQYSHSRALIQSISVCLQKEKLRYPQKIGLFTITTIYVYKQVNKTEEEA
ncbi:hypothetical protein [Glaciimonas sp. GG7]